MVMVSNEDDSNLFSYLTFHWLKDLMKQGYNRQLNSIEQLGSLPHGLNVGLQSEKFLNFYLAKTKGQPLKYANTHRIMLHGFFRVMGFKFILLGESTARFSNCLFYIIYCR
jgi:hypothetical protein